MTLDLSLIFSIITTLNNSLLFGKDLTNTIDNGTIVSVRAVRKELEERDDKLSDFVKQHNIFTMPTNKETNFIATIFQNRHFEYLISEKARLIGKEVADPYVIAKAKISGACVVSQEKFKKNAAKIPNVCESFRIPCIDLKTFMENENWSF